MDENTLFNIEEHLAHTKDIYTKISEIFKGEFLVTVFVDNFYFDPEIIPN